MNLFNPIGYSQKREESNITNKDKGKTFLQQRKDLPYLTVQIETNINMKSFLDRCLASHF